MPAGGVGEASRQSKGPSGSRRASSKRDEVRSDDPVGDMLRAAGTRPGSLGDDAGGAGEGLTGVLGDSDGRRSGASSLSSGASGHTARPQSRP